MLTDLTQRPVLQGKTKKELLAFITPQLEAREPFYMKADYIIQAPVKEIAAEDDQYIAEMLYKLITTK